MRLSVDIAICTWNRAHLLHQTLASLCRMTAPDDVDWKVLVVNNRCTDTTSNVVAAFAGRLLIEEVFESVPGIASARNRALSATDADYLLFTDDDVEVASDWLLQFGAAAARHPTVAAIAGSVEPWFHDDPDPDLVAAFPSLARGYCAVDYGPEERLLAQGTPVVSANLGLRREAVTALRFDPATGHRPGSEVRGEETEFLRRLEEQGGQILWAPSVRLRHHVDASRMTLSYLRKYTVGQGRTMARLGGAPGGHPILGVPRWIWAETPASYARYRVLSVLGRRRGALEALQSHCLCLGMLTELISLRDSGRTTGDRPGNLVRSDGDE